MSQRYYGDDRAKVRAHFRSLRKEANGETELTEEVLTLPLEPGRKRPNKGVRKKSRWIREMRKEPCHYCGGPGGTIDHKILHSQGGRTIQANCVPACGPCNNFRSNMPYEDFKAFGWKERAFAQGPEH